MTLADQLPDAAVATRAHAADWRDAVKLAGRGLVDQGATTDRYTDEMLQAIDDHGPYIVIAPGFALAHSRPSDAVLHTGLSWVALDEPVEFGSEANDPVRLVVGLAATDHKAHLDVMAELAGVLADEAVLDELMHADTAGDVRAILRRVADDAS
ncbi:PTS sugar transporter subunit IIA [Paramicrobacterium agarici]|uniref:Ascorbate-specific PTS system EIIA component n=1 Tax=Paramicrobacterium agarici TaxID=630514 RepID=A0A2A9DVI4_9MICO|nr:PTS sugar transporter subunit IIA [Microbacterium agarici]PFG30002.1 PTS system ascorbate-specific IIA component [Microbacterium agarici]